MHHQTNTRAYRDLRRRIGRNIHELRLKHKMPLDKLSAKTGIGPHLLDCFEMGKHEISLFHVVCITQVLEVSVERVLAPISVR